MNDPARKELSGIQNQQKLKEQDQYAHNRAELKQVILNPYAHQKKVVDHSLKPTSLKYFDHRL